MEQNPNVLLEQLLASYAANFDIERTLFIEGLPFAAAAEFHSRAEKYVLTKSARLWAAENHEYTFFALFTHLDMAAWQQYADAALHEGRRRIKPHPEHMCSYISLVILADTIDDEVKKALRTIRYHKSFKFSFYGWSEFRVAAAELSANRTYANRAGREVAAGLEKLLARRPASGQRDSRQS
ncbi:MAG: hypothetical protein Q4B96_02900 [Bacillota bacterium]|nr:hypothetical protein [Bacillota bacterium]